MPDLVINATGSGDTEIVPAPGARQFVRVLHYRLTGDRPVTTKWYSGDSSTGTLKDIVYSTNVSGGGISTPEFVSGLIDCAPGAALTLNLSVAANVGGSVRYEVYGPTV